MGSIGLGRSDVEKLLAEQDWEDLSRRLTMHAFKRLRRKWPELAGEFAQTAIERVLSDKFAPWDPTRDPDLFTHLGSIVNTLVYNHFNSSAIKAKRATMREAERVADDSDTVEERLVSKDFAARVATRLRERVRDTDDAVNVKILELMAGGLDKPQDLADALGISADEVDDVYKAKKRLHDHLAAVRSELGWEDGDGQ